MLDSRSAAPCLYLHHDFGSRSFPIAGARAGLIKKLACSMHITGRVNGFVKLLASCLYLRAAYQESGG